MGGWGHRRHGRGVGELGALQGALKRGPCSGDPPRDVNALSKREPNPSTPLRRAAQRVKGGGLEQLAEKVVGWDATKVRVKGEGGHIGPSGELGREGGWCC